MTWVGIDQSYTGFGLALLGHDEVHTVLGKFESAKYGTGPGRLLDIERWLTRELSVLDTVEHVCLEGYANGAKFGREIAGELGYAVKRTLYLLGMPYNVVPPTSVKKFATGKGTAKKNEMLLAVYKRWGIEFSNDNLADAYTLAEIAKAVDTQDTSLTKYQQEALSKLS